MAELMKRDEKISSLKQLIERNSTQIQRALPQYVDPKRFMGLILNCLAMNPALWDCTGNSILGAILQASNMGLEIDPLIGHGAIVPFNVKGVKVARFMPMYKGLLHLAYQSGKISMIQPRAVYEKDEFVITYGLKPQLHHVPCGLSPEEAGSLKGVYAVVYMSDGNSYFEYMTKSEVDSIRNVSRAKDADAWTLWYLQMAFKTVLKRLLKNLPFAVDSSNGAARAIGVDDALDAGVNVKTEIEIMAEAEPPQHKSLSETAFGATPLPTIEPDDEYSDEPSSPAPTMGHPDKPATDSQIGGLVKCFKGCGYTAQEDLDSWSQKLTGKPLGKKGKTTLSNADVQLLFGAFKEKKIPLKQAGAYLLPIPDSIMATLAEEQAVPSRMLNSLWYKLRDVAGDLNMPNYSRELGEKQWHLESEDNVNGAAVMLNGWHKDLEASRSVGND